MAAPAHAGRKDDGKCSRHSCTSHGGHQGQTCFSPCSIVIVIPPPVGPGEQPPPKDGETESFFPPDPSKIPAQVAAFVKVVGDFVTAVFSFAVSN
jgi:hypothetical protein